MNASLSLLLAGLLLVSAAPSSAQTPGATTSVRDRSANGPTVPPRLVEIYAPTTLAAGTVANFRVRASRGTPRPYTSLWDFGNGVLSAGNPVAHVYHTPGRYTIRVIARNAAGSDTLSMTMEVTAPSAHATAPAATQSAPAPASETASATDAAPVVPAVHKPVVHTSSLRGSDALSRTDGWTWVVGSDQWKERLEQRLLRYRLQNYRAEMRLDASGSGSPVYRLLIGEFATEAEALAARAWLPPGSTPIMLQTLQSFR